MGRGWGGEGRELTDRQVIISLLAVETHKVLVMNKNHISFLLDHGQH